MNGDERTMHSLQLDGIQPGRSFPKRAIRVTPHLSSGFFSRQIAPRKHPRVLPTCTRPNLFGGDSAFLR